ncbi:hypothetical protein [Variovorax sp. JS1663]|uniref:hypothetical protein n=1 Tax=Variovorax sp. JS1663 TaxID=1851577 RepID=UPI00118104CF|nr:hypothetical protein [Variovorax sp. JS1663]
MKPNANPPGTPFSFDRVAIWLFPDLWNEKKEIRYRGLWFVMCYTLSMLIFFAIVIIPGALIFSITLPVAFLIVGVAGALFGMIAGFCAWWDFCRRRRAIEQPSRDSHQH